MTNSKALLSGLSWRNVENCCCPKNLEVQANMWVKVHCTLSSRSNLNYVMRGLMLENGIYGKEASDPVIQAHGVKSSERD